MASTEHGEPDHAPVVRLENVSVAYRVPHQRVGTFKEYMVRRLLRKLNVRWETFWALRDIDLTVRSGEVFGVIGPNGAGKSTLLKLIARVLRPTMGRVWVKGRVAPLLDLGAGFHPELSGRENILLNGAILGFSRTEMIEKLDGIIRFAELEEFIDAPLRTYSSGMWARLGFSVATDVDPDVLVVDEVLAVGDEAFQRKSSGRMRSFPERGATVLFVSHNMTAIREMCHRVAWLDRGRIRALGPPAEIVEAYQADGTG